MFSTLQRLGTLVSGTFFLPCKSKRHGSNSGKVALPLLCCSRPCAKVAGPVSRRDMPRPNLTREEIRSRSQQRRANAKQDAVVNNLTELQAALNQPCLEHLQSAVLRFHNIVKHSSVPEARLSDLADVCQVLVKVLEAKVHEQTEQTPASVLYFAKAEHLNLRQFVSTLVTVVRLNRCSNLLSQVLVLLRSWRKQGTRMASRRPDPFVVPDDLWFDLAEVLVEVQHHGHANVLDDLREQICLLAASSALASLEEQGVGNSNVCTFIQRILSIPNLTLVLGEEWMWSELRHLWVLIPAFVTEAKSGTDPHTWEGVKQNLDFVYAKLHHMQPSLAKEWQSVRWHIRDENPVVAKVSESQPVRWPSAEPEQACHADHVLDLSTEAGMTLESA